MYFDDFRFSGKADGTCLILLAGKKSRRKLEQIIKKAGFKKTKNKDVSDKYNGNDATLVIRRRGSPVVADYQGNDETGIAPNLQEVLKLKGIEYALYLGRFCHNNHLPDDAISLGKRLSEYFPHVVVLDEFPRGKIIYDSRNQLPSIASTDQQ